MMELIIVLGRLNNISELKNEEISIILLSKLRRTDWMAWSHYAISQM